jgi:hypothetical protein
MKLATRINSYLRIEGYDLEKSFSDFLQMSYYFHMQGLLFYSFIEQG